MTEVNLDVSLGYNFYIRPIPSPDGSELYLCPTNCGLSDKGARPAGRVRRSRIALLSLGNRKRTEVENDLESCGHGRRAAEVPRPLFRYKICRRIGVSPNNLH